MPLNIRSTKTQSFLIFAIVYCIFIIYGSLVPLNYRYIPLDQALTSFQQIRYLNLGAASRADWISNIVLYIPFAFSLAAYFLNAEKLSTSLFFRAIFILVGCISLAFCIEFTQQFFPPRTVSQNDLIAEAIGSVIGLGVWVFYSQRILQLYTRILSGGKDALFASVILYCLLYLALSIFPFDFVTSIEEFQDKLNQGSDTFFISDSCGKFIQCGSKLLVEFFIVLPLGLFFSVLLKWHPTRIAAVIIIGFMTGIVIESLQLLLISGIAQGISVLTRMLGMAAGALLFKKISQLQKLFFENIYNIKKYLIFASIPYLFVLSRLNGWSFSRQSFFSNISEKVDAINWLPFYYHYYTTEAVALTSLLSVFAMYLPVAIGFWLRSFNNNSKVNSKLMVSIYVASLCFIIETGKLFFAEKHPDPTNLIISFASAFLTYGLVQKIYQWFYGMEVDNKELAIETVAPIELIALDNKKEKASESLLLPKQQTSHLFFKIIACILFTLTLWKVVDYPDNVFAIMAILLIYSVLLYRYPAIWILIIPALLPIADLSPWTGRLFFTELDFFIAVTLSINLFFNRLNSPGKLLKPVPLILFSVYAFFFLISLLIGLLPLQTIGDNAFSNYYSHYNSLRIGKGLIWGLLFIPQFAYYFQHKLVFKKYFTYGILAGLSITVMFAVWERYLFTGLFDYTSDFRITSTFYSMHTGGAHLDSYLMLCIPFIFLLLLQSQNLATKFVVTPLLFCASFYTLLVTYSRGSYLAFVFAGLIFFIGILFCYKDRIIDSWKKTLWVPAFLLLIIIISAPVLKGSFIQHRFSQMAQEADLRTNHWGNAIYMMDEGVFSTLFGMGIGSFPRTYLMQSLSEHTPATFMLQQEQTTSYLQLSSGTPVYLEQNIKVLANTDFKLTLDYRIHSKNSQVNISICEKAIQHSFNCQGIKLLPENISDQWQQFEQTINTKQIGNNKGRPIKLILSNPASDTLLDIKNLVLTSPQNTQVLVNGDFENGLDHWFFTSDSHIPWRTENLWVQILFDQGWLGLIVFTLILIYVIVHLIKQILNRNEYSLIVLTSLSGFLIVGIIDSSFDMPAITLLFFMIYYFGIISDEKVAG